MIVYQHAKDLSETEVWLMLHVPVCASSAPAMLSLLFDYLLRLGMVRMSVTDIDNRPLPQHIQAQVTEPVDLVVIHEFPVIHTHHLGHPAQPDAADRPRHGINGHDIRYNTKFRINSFRLSSKS